MADAEPAWHALPASELAARHGVDPSVGLGDEAVRRQRERFGPNALPPPPKPSALRQFLGQFLNPLVGTLLAAAAIAVGVAVWGHEGGGSGLSRYSDAIAILTIVVVNALIGFYQERKAEKALDALMKLSAARCKVLRGGEALVLDAKELVPGDVVLLEAGDRVPADLRLLTTTELQTVEGELTGESTPVEKAADVALDDTAPIADRATMVFSGTTVVHGEGRGLVAATGRETQVGRVGKMLADVEKGKSPLEEAIDDFGTRILWICVAISAALFVIGAVKGNVAWHVLLLTAVSVAVAAIPEGLPAITSITLALGMQRMAQRGAILRKLAAVETLGCATVVCTDKTGTLTRNEMTVRVVDVEGYVCAHVRGVTFGLERGGDVASWPERRNERPEHSAPGLRQASAHAGLPVEHHRVREEARVRHGQAQHDAGIGERPCPAREHPPHRSEGRALPRDRAAGLGVEPVDVHGERAARELEAPVERSDLDVDGDSVAGAPEYPCVMHVNVAEAELRAGA
jgi:Ca2+-transporting ATPase